MRPVRRAQGDRALFERFADPGDRVDLQAVVEQFLPLARQLAARYAGRGEPFDDVFQVACVALVKAIRRYDPTRGRAFSSYAVPTIVGEIKRHFRDRTWSVRPPRGLQELTLTVAGAYSGLERELSREPTVGEIAERLNRSDADVVHALQARHARQALSLEAPTELATERWAPSGKSSAWTSKASPEPRLAPNWLRSRPC
jgi:RNA polymerase sigma-B factor